MENKIKLLILDIDGIMTDGTKTYNLNGIGIAKNFCDKDWTAIKRFKAIGVEVMFLTGDIFNIPIAKNRQIDCIVNRKNGNHVCKSEFLPEIMEKYKVTKEEIVYFGDDLFDIGIMNEVEFAYCPKDAPKIVKYHCNDVIEVNGGKNAVSVLFEYLEHKEWIVKVPYIKVMKAINELDKKQIF